MVGPVSEKNGHRLASERVSTVLNAVVREGDADPRRLRAAHVHAPRAARSPSWRSSTKEA